MNRLKLTLALLVLTLGMNAQKTQTTFIQEVEGKTKQEIFSSLNKWVALNYNSAMNVIQLSDANGGSIIVKGINTLILPNRVYKAMLPNNPSISDNVEAKLNHVLDFSVKEGRYRLSFSFSYGNGSSLGSHALLPLTEDEKKQRLDNPTKLPFTSKKKELVYEKLSLDMLEDERLSIIEFIEQTNKSVFNEVSSSTVTEDW